MTGAPEELRRTVAKVISEGVRDAQYADDVADAVLAVPAIADALARDAKVAEIVADFPYGATDSQMVAMAEEVLDAHRWTAP